MTIVCKGEWLYRPESVDGDWARFAPGRWVSPHLTVEGLTLPFDAHETIRQAAEPAKAATTSKRYLTVKQLAERWNVCPLTVHRRVKAGTLRAFRLTSRSMRIALDEIERVESQGAN
jgi:excisionase family DNA binding protein